MESTGIDYLAGERRQAQFDVDAMKIVWAGSKHALDVTDRMSRIVASDPVRYFFQTLLKSEIRVQLAVF